MKALTKAKDIKIYYLTKRIVNKQTIFLFKVNDNIIALIDKTGFDYSVREADKLSYIFLQEILSWHNDKCEKSNIDMILETKNKYFAYSIDNNQFNYVCDPKGEKLSDWGLSLSSFDMIGKQPTLAAIYTRF